MTARTPGPCLFPDTSKCGRVGTYGKGQCRGDACYESQRTYKAKYANELIRELAPIGPWVEQARCGGVDLAVFYPDSPDHVLEALKICARCPVKDECLDHAMTNGERWGVWGGTTEGQRRRLRRSRRVSA